jgi:hypothetical protein
MPAGAAGRRPAGEQAVNYATSTAKDGRVSGRRLTG